MQGGLHGPAACNTVRAVLDDGSCLCWTRAACGGGSDCDRNDILPAIATGGLMSVAFVVVLAFPRRLQLRWCSA